MIQARTTAAAHGPVVNPPESVTFPSPGAAPPAAVTGLAAGLGAAAAMIQLRRLRYYRDLLLQGFESTVSPDRPASTLRQERLALGIDHPELDAVALWSVRCGDGTVAIPFIEYILARAREAATTFRRKDEDGELARELERLDETLFAIAPAGGPVPALPRLEDVYVPEEDVAHLCGSGGILDRMVDCCEVMSLAAARDTAATAS